MARPTGRGQVTTAMVSAPDRILDSAERCMARYGLRVSMRDVAAEAGLSRGSVYRYYADRDALVAAVLERTADRFVGAAAEVVDTQVTLADQVAEAAVFIRSHLGDEGLTLRLPAERESLLAAVMTAGSGRLVERWGEFWLPRLAARRGARRGAPRPGPPPRRRLDRAADAVVRAVAVGRGRSRRPRRRARLRP